jgi:hypothetical protein
VYSGASSLVTVVAQQLRVVETGALDEARQVRMRAR